MPETTETTEETTTETEEGKTFTQDEVNAIVKQRAERMVRQQLGDDFDLDKLPDLKTAQTRLQELEDAQKTELQRAQEAQQAAETRSQEFEAQLQRTRAETALLHAAVGKTSNPKLLVKLVDLDSLDPSDDKAVTAAIDKALEEAPELKGNGTRVPSADGGARTTADTFDMNTMIRQRAGRA